MPEGVSPACPKGSNSRAFSSVRLTRGDEKKWREEQRQGFGKYNFGLNGCWVADGEGNLDYVPEASYTEELWEEMRKRNNMTLKH